MQIKRRAIAEIPSSLTAIPKLLQRIYTARGIQDESQLDKRLQSLLPYNQLSGIDKASDRLEKALRHKQRILVIGDFDADGATSTAVAISALKTMGASHVDYLVPNRFEFGYGLTPAIVEVARQRAPDLLITVDNGIASIDGVEAANQAGIDVLITDHHLPGEQLPKACAIVNPNQSGDQFSSKSMAGVGVIFYVMLALRRQLVNSNWFTEQGIEAPNMAQFLDLVALGTVADVVSLDQNNRIMVSQGLARIRQGHCRPGIRALLEAAGKSTENIRESDMGFSVAPRLNAAGRLDDMSLGIECLLCEDMNRARNYAAQLDELNQERRQIEAEMKEQALAVVNQMTRKMDQSVHLPPALCLMDENWHQGVIGILAGRLKDRFHRPVIAFAVVSETEMKGSARSVTGLNIRDVLAEIDTHYPGLINRFGGHAMAAGLSLHPGAFSDFQKVFIEEVARHVHVLDPEGVLLTDGSLSSSELHLETALMLQQAGPWGQQFPEPCFDDVFEIIEQRLVGKNHLKLSLIHEQGGETIDAIAFNVDLNQWPNHRLRKLHMAYKLDVNVFQRRSRLQLIAEVLSPLD
ncbi:single-stranded-DNA-specific exonuclease RecJ [Legionella birminghamensis]|uniref:Single-stranded-DNA-specific exonuclease RecJ n=1 Tax=Legionella birminghamensis TaxID=28083 RepID=A0A378IHV1_9GAMM|nr:single-stranded-DNA-specific exonuclease RecJ [Legionella birminghamensis]KTC74863.1 single-stranded-DNA-specific exonuclease RecJ [Legionella birminghamensis]STX31764.1 single-stranded-DNA-specific exonuclease [Legionella birminghamensis]